MPDFRANLRAVKAQLIARRPLGAPETLAAPRRAREYTPGFTEVLLLDTSREKFKSFFRPSVLPSRSHIFPVIVQGSV